MIYFNSFKNIKVLSKIKTISLIIICLLFSITPVNAQKIKKVPNILILFASQSNTPAYNRILSGMTDRFSESYGDSININLEYLDKENYPAGKYPREQFDLINEKYRNSNLDLLISVGINAIEIIKTNAADYLLKLPVVSLDLDFSDFGYPSNLSLNERTTEIRLKLNFEKSIKEAMELFPKTDSVYFIGGVSNFDKLMLSISKQVAEKILKNKSVNFITDLTMDEITARVKNLPDNSLAIMANFNMDQKKVVYNNPESVRIISRSSDAPLFIYTSTGFGEGAIGGYILDFEKAGWISGDAAVRILNGTDPTSIKVDENDFYRYLYDWRALKRWKIENSNRLPDGSTVLYKEADFLDDYKWIFGVSLLFLILQSSLIANLIRLNRNQKIMTAQIIDAQNKYKDFLHEDRSLRLGQLTASLSHEIAQPLTAILSNAQAGINFIKSNQATPELLTEILQKIVENDKRTASIINSIRGMLKVENREKEKIELNSVIDEVLQIYKGEAIQNHIEIDFRSTEQNVYVLADRIQIQQVLINLIINAAQSMEKLNTKNKNISISQSINDQKVIVSICDNGSGIDELYKEKLFRPFESTKLDGMGIGLAICRNIIEDHFGEIWAENLPQGGAKFSFSLKVIKDG